VISPISDVASIRRLSRFALAGVSLFTGVVLLLHVIRPEYDLVTRFVSEYAVTDPLVLGIACIALGLGSTALVKAMTMILPRERGLRAGIVLLWIWAACITGVGLFPADEFPTINPPSWHGAIHAIFGLIGFFCFSAGSLVVSFRLHLMPSWQKVAPLLTSLSTLCAVFFVLFYAGLPAVGLIQRIFGAFVLTWIAMVARTLMTRPNASSDRTTVSADETAFAPGR